MTRTPRQHGQIPQRRWIKGFSTLLTVSVLLYLTTLAMLHISRVQTLEQKLGANQWRRVVAQDMAESGLAWLQQQLNTRASAAPPCAGAPAGRSLRAHLLQAREDGGWQLRHPTAPWQAACVMTAEGRLQCQCASDTPAELPDAEHAQGGFALRLQALPAQPSVLRVWAVGCNGRTRGCLSFPADGAQAEAPPGQSRQLITQDLALVSSLKVLPAAALLLGQDLHGAQQLTLHNQDPRSPGLLLNATQVLSPADLQLSAASRSVGGTPLPQALRVGDSAQGAQTELLRHHIGMAWERYLKQPGAQVLDCAEDCSAALQAAVDQGQRFVVLPDGAVLSTPLNLGSADAPLLLAARGSLRVQAALTLHGALLVAGNLQWQSAAGGVSDVLGAVLVGGSMRVESPVTVRFDAQALMALHAHEGSFVPVPASWNQLG
ncbi:hypothetical protein ACG0Z6_13115 [Roseateles sp. BYS180W]|uniref:DUF2125 domain-containing protein n=2 Tax=Roseateles rivi TaxID=3299028 RepID=A0ABW7FXY8_9BURK